MRRTGKRAGVPATATLGVGGAGRTKSGVILRFLWRKKAFFSEEKKQKTFTSLSRIYPAAYAKETKVFWFFFSKKNAFLFSEGVAPGSPFW
jgi:hypothetical protein